MRPSIFTPDEDNYIIKNYASRNLYVISRDLQCSYTSLKNRLRHLGIEKESPRVARNKKCAKALEMYFGLGMSMMEISHKMNSSLNTISRYINSGLYVIESEETITITLKSKV